MPGGRPSGTGILPEKMVELVERYISEEVEFDQSYSITRYMIARNIRDWWKEKIAPDPPYNVTSILYRLLEGKHKCKIDASNAFAGKVSPQVRGCRVKNMVDATDRNQYEMNFCLYCHRIGTELIPAFYEEAGMECKDMDDCVDYSQARLASGEQLPKPPDITRFPNGYKRLSLYDKTKLLNNRLEEIEAIITYLQTTELPDREKQIKYMRVRRSTTRKEIQQLEYQRQNESEQLKEHKKQWNRQDRIPTERI